MLKYLPLLITICSLNGCNTGEQTLSPKHKVLLQDYNLLIIDNEIHKLHQSNDTLYEFHCYVDRPCIPKPEKHYKILSEVKKLNFIILTLERLDTLSHFSQSLSPNRFLLLALKDVTYKKLGYLPLSGHAIKAVIDTINTDSRLLRKKFFFTYYSDSSLREFANLKPVVNKNDAQAILSLIRSGKYQRLINRYKKTKTRDIYGSDLQQNCSTELVWISGITFLVQE